mgnify:FL=1
MIIKSNALSQHLKKGFQSIYFIFGAEDLLILESLDLIRKTALDNDFSDRNKFTVSGRFNWNEVNSSFKNQSLFGGKQYLEIHIPNSRPGKQGSESIINLLDEVHDEAMLVIVAGKIETDIRRSKWFKSLEKKAITVSCEKVYLSHYPKWIRSRLSAKGLEIDRDALDMFVVLTEGNLMVAKQSIDRLIMMEVQGRVTIKDVSNCVADGAHFDLFQLTDAAMMNKKDRVFKIFSRLKSEGMQPFELMRVVNWELKNLSDLMTDVDDGQSVRQAMQTAKVWQSKQKMIGDYLSSRNKQNIDDLIHQACEVDKTIKGVKKGNPWDEVGNLLLMLSSVHESSKR